MFENSPATRLFFIQIVIATYVPTGYVEVTDFALVAVYSSHVWFTLALTGQLIACQRSESCLCGAKMETITRFAIAFFGSQSVPEVS